MPSLAILRFESHAVSFRGALLREPGIHTPRLVVMDSGLATKRWRPGMTDLIRGPLRACDRFHRIGPLAARAPNGAYLAHHGPVNRGRFATAAGLELRNEFAGLLEPRFERRAASSPSVDRQPSCVPDTRVAWSKRRCGPVSCRRAEREQFLRGMARYLSPSRGGTRRVGGDLRARHGSDQARHQRLRPDPFAARIQRGAVAIYQPPRLRLAHHHRQ